MRARVEGTVQGVGFRPYVFRLAAGAAVDGWVLNDELGVLLEVEGSGAAVASFLERLPIEAPPLASVEGVTVDELAATGERGFRILSSERHGEAEALVSPDAATCADCLRELFDPADRRHRYPFVNCTNCGPRFTIVRGVPYDRALTTMAGFEMCAACRAEYDDPADRRFHAEPNACPVCGPAAVLLDGAGEPADRAGDPVRAAADSLREGHVLSLKGLGGYHLAARADSEDAVAALRARKHREDKPFALMAPDLETAGALVELGPVERELLTGRERPIVIARRRPTAAVAASVAPRTRDLGVMLPYTPLHHLLLADAGTTLVLTSGNVSDEPIAYADDDALERLRGIADRHLVHDRPIHIRTDDSVVRATRAGSGRPLTMRRARGHVPASLGLPIECPRPLLAFGAELKSTFCVAKGRRAWVSHHIGDLQNLETLRSFREGIDHFERVFAVEPEVAVHDLHPEYLSTKEALARPALEPIGVQHHHAHLAACLAEHGETGRAVGAIYDGTGYGADGTVWGGELLVGDLRGFERAGALFAVRLPGGERAIREPWRMALAWLAAALDEPEPSPPAMLSEQVERRRWRQVAELVRTGVGSPLTTSMGRLFDAVAALCAVRAYVSYEGQAAAELEGLAAADERGAYPLGVVEAAPVGVGGAAPLSVDAAPLVLDAREAILAVARDVRAGVAVPTVSARFHNGVADATAAACSALAERHGLASVALSGGSFQNRLLLERTSAALERAGLRVLRPERLPPNDGGISYGQAAVAAARLADGA